MEALTTKTGIIYLAVRTNVARTKVGSIERLIEKGFISFAAVGTTIETRHVHQTWAQLRIFRREAGSAIFPCAIAAGYVDTQSTAIFTGRLPVYPGDSLILEAMSTAIVDVSAIIRFETE